jgi:hypothetical protein
MRVRKACVGLSSTMSTLGIVVISCSLRLFLPEALGGFH